MATDGAARPRMGAMGGRVSVGAPGDPALARTHARLLLQPLLQRTGCDPAPLEAVLDALVGRRGLDGPATVHWLLGTHPRLPLGARPLDVWRRGAHAELVRLAA